MIDKNEFVRAVLSDANMAVAEGFESSLIDFLREAGHEVSPLWFLDESWERLAAVLYKEIWGDDG